MRLMIAGNVLSISVGIMLLGLGLLVVIAGLVTGSAPSTVGGSMVLVVGAIRFVSTVKRMRTRRQLMAARYVVAWHLEFLLLSVSVSGVGLVSVVTGLGARTADARISGALLLVLGVAGGGATIRSMRRMRQYRASRFLFAWTIQAFIGGMVLLGLGVFVLLRVLGTKDAANVGYALVGGIVLLLGMSNIMWCLGRLRTIGQEGEEAVQQERQLPVRIP